jgi:hypothetical protein
VTCDYPDFWKSSIFLPSGHRRTYTSTPLYMFKLRCARTSLPQYVMAIGFYLTCGVMYARQLVSEHEAFFRIGLFVVACTGTQRRGRVDSLPASYSRGSGIESFRSVQTNSRIVRALFNVELTVRVKLFLCLINEASRH